VGHVIPVRRSRRRRAVAAIVLLSVALGWWVWSRGGPAGSHNAEVPSTASVTASTSPPPSSAPSDHRYPDHRFDEARDRLALLPVKGWDRGKDFVRSRFGEAWSDDVDVEFGHNGCNTRDDILRRDLTDLVVRPGTCYAERGILHDPYTGAQIPFTRGPHTSAAVQIDHVVALADAWYKGARLWTDQRRRDFANDPRNLLAVDAGANFDKAFRDAASWLPPNGAFRCDYVARQIEVKAAYGVWVAQKEKAALAAVLRDC
jgi:hypothetical protein